MCYFLNGMLLEIRDGHVRSVATDGHRLALGDLVRNSLGCLETSYLAT